MKNKTAEEITELIERALLEVACDPDKKGEMIKAAQMLLSKYDPAGYGKTENTVEKKEDQYSAESLLQKLND